MSFESVTDHPFEHSAESGNSGQMDLHGLTHVGRKRPTNEDQFLIADLKKSMRIHQTSLGLDHQTRLFGGSQGKLLLVADGMGGHEAANDQGGSDNITVVVARFCEQAEDPCVDEAQATSRLDQVVDQSSDTDPYIKPAMV